MFNVAQCEHLVGRTRAIYMIHLYYDIKKGLMQKKTQTGYPHLIARVNSLSHLEVYLFIC
jgi:hypothetical protein